MPTTAHLPSPSSTASLSPRQHSKPHDMTRHSSCSDDEPDVHEGGDMAARSALEIRREKNRIKQRNLRLRRANQMADLETTVNTLRAKGHELADRIVELEAREENLVAWVRDLEGALRAQGQDEHVDALRRVWAPSSRSRDPRGDTRERERERERDPLATLASAASRRRWDDVDNHAHSHAHGIKRRREDDLPPLSRLPSPSRMRISDLVLPQPNGHQSRAHPSQPWGWSQLPALDLGYDQKPFDKARAVSGASASAVTGVDERERDVRERVRERDMRERELRDRDIHRDHEAARPQRSASPSHNSSSHASSNPRWQSPVQSFHLRL